MSNIHETILYVKEKSITKNLEFFKKKLDKKTKVIAVVKAYAYGLGDINISKILEFLKVDAFWVADFEEGISLRKNGIKSIIIVANPGVKSISEIIKYNLEVTIYNLRILKKLGNFKKPLNIHLKFNTGMNRFGFSFSDIDLIIQTLEEFPLLTVVSICSHLASSDKENNDNFSILQFDNFSKICKKIDAKLDASTYKHILNTNGIIRFADQQYNAVRIGIGLFGIIDNQEIKQVCKLKTIITQVRNISRNEFVGYGLKFKANKNLRIGIVPFGYADGLDRRLGNGVGNLYVNNTFCEIIGEISMDSCAINLTNTNAEEGEDVEIFGENILITTICRKIETTPYEFISKINRRIKRVYI